MKRFLPLPTEYGDYVFVIGSELGASSMTVSIDETGIETEDGHFKNYEDFIEYLHLAEKDDNTEYTNFNLFVFTMDEICILDEKQIHHKRMPKVISLFEKTK